MAWMSGREIKIYILVVGSVTLVALSITLAVMLPGYIRYNKNKVQSTLTIQDKIDMSRFIIPESYMKLRDPGWIPFRADKGRWTSADIEPFWQDPEILILEYLEVQNESLINELYEDIP